MSDQGTISQERPGLVTVAMTIFNEERWLREAIESLLAQTYEDLEILILDNASTDASSAIAAEFVQRDPRIRHVLHERNLGANENYHRGVLEARGEYFLMAAGHDLWSPNYVKELVAALGRSEAVLAFGATTVIDENGKELIHRGDICSTEGIRSPLHRFNLYMWADQLPVYGLVRTTALRSVRTNLQIVAGGQVLLQELAILGEFAYRPDAVFQWRRVRAREKREQRSERNIVALLPEGHRASFPYWRVCREIRRAAWRAPIRGRARRRLRFQLVLSSLSAYARFFPYLVDDLRIGNVRRRLLSGRRAGR